MDWPHSIVVSRLLGPLFWLLFAVLLLLLLPTTTVATWSLSKPALHWQASRDLTYASRKLNEVSPYFDLAFCPLRSEPWNCARQQSARLLDVWDSELHAQWQKLKVEADRQLNATIQKRGYSATELPIKEKPSTLLKKIEIGSEYMKGYLAETMKGFLGSDDQYLQTSKAAVDSENDNDHSASSDGNNHNNNVDYDDEADEQTDTGEEEEDDGSASVDQEHEDEDDEQEDEETDADEDETENESAQQAAAAAVNVEKQTELVGHEENASNGAEFIEIVDGEEHTLGKRPGGGKRKQKNKRKKKKKKGQEQQPATLVVVQAAPEHHDVSVEHESVPTVVSQGAGHGHGKPFKRKQKRGKRKKKGQHGGGLAAQHDATDNLGLGLLDDLLSVDDVLGGGGKRKHKNPINYGRSNGVNRSKKKKKKKALMKLVLLGSFLKAKIELLLKILGAHLQIKFFAIALIGLLINIARFWIDVKRGSPPSKVVYVEHAHHQHHYEDHADEWSEPSSGSYWKRSLQTDPAIEDSDSSTDSYQVRSQNQQPLDAHYLAYRNQYQWQ